MHKAAIEEVHHVPSDELLATVLGSERKKSVVTVANELVRSAGGIAGLSRSTAREIAQVAGVGAARAARIAAAFELGRRALAAVTARSPLGRPDDIFRMVSPRLAGLVQEVFIVVGLDIRNGLVDVVEVARGTAVGVEVHPREVFRPLIRMAAAGGVLVHNHPSGDPTPSGEDIDLTRRLAEVGRLLGIPIIDHVVIAHDSFRSIAEWAGLEPSGSLPA